MISVNKKIIVVASLTFLTILTIFGLAKYISKGYDEDHSFTKNGLSNITQPSQLNFPRVLSTNFDKDFPAKWFLDTVDYTSISDVNKVLIWMDSLNKDKSHNQQFLSVVLTDSLLTRFKLYSDNYNPDFLNTILLWAEKMKIYSGFNSENQMFYDVVSSYWVNYVSNSLSKFSDLNSSIKYNFKFKYLVSKCSQNGNVRAATPSSVEKLITNVIESKWWYIIDRLMNGTSLIFKIAFFTFSILIMFSFYCMILFIKKKI